MKNLALLLLLISVSASSQNVEIKRTQIIERRYADFQLEKALTEKLEVNIGIILKNEKIKDSVSAVRSAEKVLFKLYGQENISAQKPYHVYLVNEYWVIWGTIPQDSIGGTFLIILDSRNSKILKVTHGK